MAFVDLPVSAWPTPPVYDNATAPANGSIATMSASGAMVAVICRAPRTGNIQDVTWGTRTVTTGATVGVDVQGVDLSNGFPDASSLGSAGSQVVNSSDDNVFFTTALGSVAAVTRGQLIAVVVSNSGSGNMQAMTTASQGIGLNYPYAASHNGTSWSKVATQPMLGLRYDNNTYYPIAGVWGPGAFANNDLQTSTTPDVAGVRFRLAAAVRVCGAWAQVFQNTANFDIKLVTTAYHQVNQTGILASAAHDVDVRRNSASAIYWWDFDAAVELAANTYYRLIVEPTVNSLLRLHSVTLGSSALLGCFAGSDWEYTSAKDPTADGSWTQANNYALMGLLVNGIDTSSGGGSVTGVPLGRVFTGF